VNLWQKNYPTTLIIAKRNLFVNLNLFQILFQLDSETSSALQVDFKFEICGSILKFFCDFGLKTFVSFVVKSVST
jgi:hypothetical protein